MKNGTDELNDFLVTVYGTIEEMHMNGDAPLATDDWKCLAAIITSYANSDSSPFGVCDALRFIASTFNDVYLDQRFGGNSR